MMVLIYFIPNIMDAKAYQLKGRLLSIFTSYPYQASVKQRMQELTFLDQILVNIKVYGV